MKTNIDKSKRDILLTYLTKLKNTMPQNEKTFTIH